MKLIEVVFCLIFLGLAATVSWADLSSPPKNVEQQYFLNKNKLPNGGFEQGVFNVSASSGTPTTTSASTKIYEGSYAMSWDPPAAATLDVASWTAKTNAKGQGYAKCAFKATDSTYTFYVYDSTNSIQVSPSIPIQTESSGSIYQVAFTYFTIPGDGNSRTYKTRISADSNLSEIDIDDCYLGYSSYDAVSTNINQMYSIHVNSADVTSNENVDWVNGDCTSAATGRAICNFNSGVFVNPPNCTCTADFDATQCYIFTTATSSAVTLVTRNSAGTATDSAFNLSCQKSDTASGYVVKANQTNFDWMDVTCGSSWTTNATNTCKAKRQGSNAIIKHKITLTGAPQSTTLRLTPPNGWLIDTARFPGTVGVSSTILGSEGSILDNGANTYTTIEQYSSTSVVGVSYITSASGTISAVTQALPFTFSGGDVVEVQYEIPVAGWTENQNAPNVIGSIINSYSNTAMRMETAQVVTTGTIANEYGDFISGNCTNASPQVCTMNSGLFSSTPNCSATCTDTGSNTTCQISVASTTSFSIKCQNDAGSTQTTSVSKNVICVGPR